MGGWVQGPYFPSLNFSTISFPFTALAMCVQCLLFFVCKGCGRVGSILSEKNCIGIYLQSSKQCHKVLHFGIPCTTV